MQLSFEFVEPIGPEPLAQVWNELDAETKSVVVTVLAKWIVKALAQEEHDNE